MANEIPWQVEMIRRGPDRPVTAYFRLLSPAGECVGAFAHRLKNRVTFHEFMSGADIAAVEVDTGDPDALISARVRRCNWRNGLRRDLSRLLDRLRRPTPALPDTARIAPFKPEGVATSSASPLVSIIIPTRDRTGLLAAAVETLFEKSNWPQLELVIVDNGSVEPESFAFFDRLRAMANVSIIRQDEPFNFARLINAGARAAQGEVLALLNNDVEARSPDWLEPLVRLAIDPRVGAVGAKLLYENGTIQHAGIMLGIRGLTSHAGVGRPADDPGPYAMLTTTRRVSAVTGACLLTRRDVFEELGGLDENFVIEFNDVDYCLRAGAKGYAVIYAAEPMLLHKEGATRQARPLREQEVQDRSLFMRRWGRALVDDPYYPPDLTLCDESLSPAEG
ncbi:MAG: glycosyltransferase family 2 protein [Chloroflexota bacterium]